MLNTLFYINDEIILIAVIILVLLIISGILIIMFKNKRKENKELDTIISNMVQERKEVKEEIEEIDDKTKELEDVLEKMQKDLEAKPVDVVASFEKEQEEKAIISYSELVKTLKKGKEEEKTLDILVDEIKEAAMKEEPEEKKFKNTAFISPVYGKMNEHLDYPKVEKTQELNFLEELEEFDKKISDYHLDNYLEEFSSESNELTSLEQTLDMEPISEEIKRNEDFLKALIEFRENL